MIEKIPYMSMPNNKKVRDIKLVKAAIVCGADVYTGWRHAHIIQYLASHDLIHSKVTQDQQGFIDQDGVFYRREGCSGIAFMNGQTKTFINTLTSEDLWDVNGNPK